MSLNEPNAGRDGAVPLRLTWLHPNGLVSLSFVNFFLRFLTLGFYHFWGQTEVRKRIWSAVRLEGEPLVYTGTGRELMTGFLIVFGAVLLPLSLASALAAVYISPGVLPLLQVGLSAIVFYLTGVAIYRARRYRLARTQWRGIRGSLEGNSWRFGWTYVWTIALPFGLALLLPGTVAYLLVGGDNETLGAQAGLVLGATMIGVLGAFWVMPWRSIELQRILTRDMSFGNRPFTFTAPVGPLYKRYAAFWIGCALIAAGLYGVMVNTATPEMMERLQDKDDPELAANIVRFVLITYGSLGLAYLLYYLISASYRAFQYNHFAAHTHFEGATFHGTATGTGLVRNAFGNFLLWLVSFILGILAMAAAFFISRSVLGLDPEGVASQVFIVGGIVLLIASTGLFKPIIQARTTGYLARNLSIDGKVPLAGIAQGADQKILRGEGLAQAFDVDAF